MQLSIATICDLSIVVAKGHSELWRQKATKRVSVTLQMLWLIGHNELWRPKPAKVVTNLAMQPAKWQHWVGARYESTDREEGNHQSLQHSRNTPAI